MPIPFTPFVLRNFFAVPQLTGTCIDLPNVTYNLQDCISTHQGLICNGLARQMEPCLLHHSSDLCILTLFPVNNYSALYEIEVQHICLVSNNQTEMAVLGAEAPYSGCLQHLEVPHWQGDVFYLSPV